MRVNQTSPQNSAESKAAFSAVKRVSAIKSTQQTAARRKIIPAHYIRKICVRSPPVAATPTFGIAECDRSTRSMAVVSAAESPPGQAKSHRRARES
jgi:hypothetical protein